MIHPCMEEFVSRLAEQGAEMADRKDILPKRTHKGAKNETYPIDKVPSGLCAPVA